MNTEPSKEATTTQGIEAQQPPDLHLDSLSSYVDSCLLYAQLHHQPRQLLNSVYQLNEVIERKSKTVRQMCFENSEINPTLPEDLKFLTDSRYALFDELHQNVAQVTRLTHRQAVHPRVTTESNSVIVIQR